MDSQRVKTVEETAHIRGYDAHNSVKGRTRHLLVNTLGLPPADVPDTVGARKLLGGLAYFVPRLKIIWADAAYRGKELNDWCQQQGDGWVPEIVEREPGTKGFQGQPRRWVVERCFARVASSSAAGQGLTNAKCRRNGSGRPGAEFQHDPHKMCSQSQSRVFRRIVQQRQ